MQVKQILRRMFTRVYSFAIFFSTNENSCFKIADRCCQQREKQSSINAFLTILSEKFFQKFDTANVKRQQFVTTQICQSSKKGRGRKKKFISHPLKSILQRWFPTYYHSVRVYARSYRTRSSN